MRKIKVVVVVVDNENPAQTTQGGSWGWGWDYMIIVSVHQIYLSYLGLPQFLLVVISKIIFTLSSQAQIMIKFIPVLFALVYHSSPLTQ